MCCFSRTSLTARRPNRRAGASRRAFSAAIDPSRAVDSRGRARFDLMSAVIENAQLAALEITDGADSP